MKILKLLSVLISIAFSVSLLAAPPKGFQSRLKQIKKERLKRERGAKSYTKARKLKSKKKLKQARAYKKVRKRQERLKKKRDSFFVKHEKRLKAAQARKDKLATRSAVKKRKKTSKVSWKDQNLEYGIKPLKKRANKTP